jgi:hypothetical protein
MANKSTKTTDNKDKSSPGVVPGFEGIKTQEFIGKTTAHILK